MTYDARSLSCSKLAQIAATSITGLASLMHGIACRVNEVFKTIYQALLNCFSAFKQMCYRLVTNDTPAPLPGNPQAPIDSSTPISPPLQPLESVPHQAANTSPSPITTTASSSVTNTNLNNASNSTVPSSNDQSRSAALPPLQPATTEPEVAHTTSSPITTTATSSVPNANLNIDSSSQAPADQSGIAVSSLLQTSEPVEHTTASSSFNPFDSDDDSSSQTGSRHSGSSTPETQSSQSLSTPPAQTPPLHPIAPSLGVPNPFPINSTLISASGAIVPANVAPPGDPISSFVSAHAHQSLAILDGLLVGAHGLQVIQSLITLLKGLTENTNPVIKVIRVLKVLKYLACDRSIASLSERFRQFSPEQKTQFFDEVTTSSKAAETCQAFRSIFSANPRQTHSLTSFIEEAQKILQIGLNNEFFVLIKDLDDQLSTDGRNGLDDLLSALEIVSQKDELKNLSKSKSLAECIQHAIGAIALKSKYMPELNSAFVNKILGAFFSNLDSLFINKVVTPIVKRVFPHFSPLTPTYYSLVLIDGLARGLLTPIDYITRPSSSLPTYVQFIPVKALQLMARITPQRLQIMASSLRLSAQSMIPDLGFSIDDLRRGSQRLHTLTTLAKEERDRSTTQAGEQDKAKFEELINTFKNPSISSILSTTFRSVTQTSAGSSTSAIDQLALIGKTNSILAARQFSHMAAGKINHMIVPIVIQKGIAIGAIPGLRQSFSLIGIITTMFIAAMSILTPSFKTHNTSTLYSEGNITEPRRTFYSDLDQGLIYAGNFASAPTGTALALVASPSFDYLRIGRKGNSSIYINPNRTGFNPIANVLTNPGSIADGVLGIVSELCVEHKMFIKYAREELAKINKSVALRYRLTNSMCSVVIPACAIATKAPAFVLSVGLDGISDITSRALGYNKTSTALNSSRIRYLSVRPELSWIPSTYHFVLIYIGLLFSKIYLKTAAALDDATPIEGESPKNKTIRKTADLIKAFLPEIRNIIAKDARQKIYIDASFEQKFLMWLQLA